MDQKKSKKKKRNPWNFPRKPKKKKTKKKKKVSNKHEKVLLFPFCFLFPLFELLHFFSVSGFQKNINGQKKNKKSPSLQKTTNLRWDTTLKGRFLLLTVFRQVQRMKVFSVSQPLFFLLVLKAKGIRQFIMPQNIFYSPRYSDDQYEYRYSSLFLLRLCCFVGVFFVFALFFHLNSLTFFFFFQDM